MERMVIYLKRKVLGALCAPVYTLLYTRIPIRMGADARRTEINVQARLGLVHTAPCGARRQPRVRPVLGVRLGLTGAEAYASRDHPFFYS